MPMKREDFTESAGEALVTSQELVRRYRHAQWDVEHVFLALLEQDDGVAVQVLREMGADPGAVKSSLTTALARTPRLEYEPTQIYQTPRVARLVENAKAEADAAKAAVELEKDLAAAAKDKEAALEDAKAAAEEKLAGIGLAGLA